MRFDFVVLLAVLNGCVCLQPVDEFPDSGSTVVEATVTSFIAPVPFEDLGESESLYWSYSPPIPYGYFRPWRGISWTTNGEILVDAVGGIILPDAGYISAANQAWRDASLVTTNSFPTWTRMNGDWYRYTYDNHLLSGGPWGPLRLWRLNRETEQLELSATIASVHDGGYYPTSVSIQAVWGGSQWWLFDDVWTGERYVENSVFIGPDIDTISSAPSYDAGVYWKADGVDVDTRLVWGLGHSTRWLEVLIRIRGTDFMISEVDAEIALRLS